MRVCDLSVVIFCAGIFGIGAAVLAVEIAAANSGHLWLSWLAGILALAGGIQVARKMLG